MAKYVDALTQSRHENKRLMWMNAGLIAVIVLTVFGWKSSQNHFTMHLPPDLRNGATVKVGDASEVPDTTVYTFAFYIWQQINRWQTDGFKDYGDQVYTLQAFLTPSCREQLVADMNLRATSGELSRRTRAVMEIPGMGYIPERVTLQGSNAWKVLLDTQILESQSNVTVKDSFIRYPLRVVRFDVDREKNPWQLALDCFGGDRPVRLDPKAVAVAKSGRTVVDVRSATTVPGTTLPPAPGLDGAASAPAAEVAATGPANANSGNFVPASLPKPSN